MWWFKVIEAVARFFFTSFTGNEKRKNRTFTWKGELLMVVLAVSALVTAPVVWRLETVRHEVVENKRATVQLERSVGNLERAAFGVGGLSERVAVVENALDLQRERLRREERRRREDQEEDGPAYPLIPRRRTNYEPREHVNPVPLPKQPTSWYDWWRQWAPAWWRPASPQQVELPKDTTAFANTRPAFE